MNPELLAEFDVGRSPWPGATSRRIVQLHTHLGTLLALRADGSVDEVVLSAYGGTTTRPLLGP